MSLTLQLAEHIAASRPGAGALAAARLALTDYLACAIAGSRGSDFQRFKAAFLPGAGKGQTLVIGSAARVDPTTAALLNAYSGHALDYDDVHASMRGHPGTVLFPALLAARRGESAARVLEAFVVGLEVAGRLGLSLGPSHYERGFHATSTVGSGAAAAAVAWLRGLPPQDIAKALSLGATQGAGLRGQFGTEVKPFHAAMAARAGLEAVVMVEAGLSGSESLLDGPTGFIALMGFDSAAPEKLLPGWGAPWQIEAPGLIFKEFACCTATHCAAQAMLHLIAQHDPAADEVAAVTVTFPPGGDAALITGPAPETGVEGRFSVEYVLARALLDRRLSVAAFDETPVSAAALALAARVRRRWDQTAPRQSNDPKTRFAEVALTLTDGRCLKRRETAVRGLSDPSEKFLDATGQNHTLLAQIRSMQSVADFDRLLSLLASAEL
ncbi:MmgE/PrpD family protein [Falsigemmobacter intermedius]|uniref:MmgE/PrpD family protein n=1 Tax=Falsigemmobacter intermedius TaxID=1553448 RepID=A0A3S3UV91_9RHOB|nr:MmgE/PrpD family protein [Falsigemmobacter intermedius]RWY41006.1 MmgE/PrpD family protein [Falsigemmobacter intermedius]